MGNETNNLYGCSLDAEIGRVTALFHKAEQLALSADEALNEELTPQAKAFAVRALREASAARLEAQLAWAHLRQKMDAGARLKPDN